MLLTLSLLAGLTLGQDGFAPQRPVGELLDPQREARVQHLGKLLRCTVCQGVAIADSPASMARAQMDKVRELVAEGKSDDEVLQYFVDRYGEWSLMEPRKSGVTLAVWLLPLLLLIGGLVVVLRQRKKTGGAALAPDADTPGPTAGEASDDYLAKVREDLER